ncbi:protein NEDD1-like [Strongylocentrotus purpuratus]|uniref:Protein NEDD1 n=1 Tax=Strongylocentrotus purpuratus TaxID=7668 RepID=A0A7M7N0N9_STRPU|nr:protein NEDD1-like [Strongylocentrotus purpuratus]
MMEEGPIKFASGGDDIKIWDLSSSTPQQLFSPHAGPISSLCWSQNNQLLASASSVGDKIVLSYGKSLSTNIIELAVGEKQTCLSMNSTSRYLVCGGKNKLVSIWDLKNKKLKRTYKEHRDSVSCVLFNWNDSYLASGSASGEILLHNVVSGQPGSPMVASNGQTIRDVGYSFFKKSLLAAASDDGSLTLWDTNTSKLVTSFSDAHNAPTTALSFSPLNNLLLASSGLDKRVVCYDVNGRSVIKTMTVESPLTSLSFMQDGATLAAGSTRGKIYVFDLRMGSAPLKTLNAHKSSVQAIRFQYANGAPKVNGPVSKSRTAGSHKKSSSSTSSIPMHEPSEPTSSIPDNVKASKESLNERTNGDPSPRYEQMDNMDIISPIREGGDSTTARTSVRNGPNSVTDDRPETMGKAETQQRRNSLPGAGIFSPLSSENDNPSIDSSVRRNPVGSVALESSPFGPIRRAFPNNLDGLDNGTTTATSNSVRFRSPLHSPVDLPSPRRTSFPTTVMDTRRIPASLNIRPVRLDSDTRMEGEEEEEAASPVTTPTIHRPVFSPEEPPKTSFPRSFPSPAPPPHTSSEAETRMNEGAVGGGTEAAGSSLQNTPFQTFQVDFIKNLIEESLDQFRVAIHRDVTNLQLEMLRQFQIQQTEIQALLQRYSVNEGLLSEIETLREENKRLKNKY